MLQAILWVSMVIAVIYSVILTFTYPLEMLGIGFTAYVLFVIASKLDIKARINASHARFELDQERLRAERDERL